MGLFEKSVEWGCKQGLEGIRKQIEKVIKEKRLVFLGNDHVLYTDKEGVKRNYTFEQIANIAVYVGGWEQQMTTLGITVHDVVNVLTEEYAKHKREVK